MPRHRSAVKKTYVSLAARSVISEPSLEDNMTSNSLPLDINMADSQALPPVPSDSEPKFGGFTRFEIELEFVQSLASPYYLNHLAMQKYLENPQFIAYLSYLQYFASPPYTKYLNYPGPTLKNLELLQQERFRKEILNLEVVQALVQEGGKASLHNTAT